MSNGLEHVDAPWHAPRTYTPPLQFLWFVTISPGGATHFPPSNCRRGLGVLRNAPKVEPQRGQMKVAKSYVKTYYSEALVSISFDMADNEREDGGLIVAEGKGHTTVKQDSSSNCGVIARTPE